MAQGRYLMDGGDGEDDEEVRTGGLTSRFSRADAEVK
jgi:hypothetical protein